MINVCIENTHTHKKKNVFFLFNYFKRINEIIKLTKQKKKILKNYQRICRKKEVRKRAINFDKNLSMKRKCERKREREKEIIFLILDYRKNTTKQQKKSFKNKNIE